jgi:putative membrane protein
MMYDGYGGWYWGMGLAHGLLWLVLLGLGIALLVRLVSRDSRDSRESREWRSNAGREAPDTALDILKKRYARGEIDKAEFDAKKKDLSA